MANAIRLRAATSADRGDITTIVHEGLLEYGLTPDAATVDADLPRVPQYYCDPGGLFHVLLDDSDQVVGTLGLLPLDERRIELRKMYFARGVRGQGIGKAVLDWAIGQARTRGFDVVELETAAVLKEALGLYRSFGFVEDADGPHTCRCDYKLALSLANYTPPDGLRQVQEVVS